MSKSNQRRLITRNVVEGEILPGKEILTGKAYKQTGTLKGNGGWGTTVEGEYWLERIPGTEQKADFWNMHTGDLEEYDAAVFEIYVKDQDNEWQKVADGPLPCSEEAWETMGGQFY